MVEVTVKNNLNLKYIYFLQAMKWFLWSRTIKSPLNGRYMAKILPIWRKTPYNQSTKRYQFFLHKPNEDRGLGLNNIFFYTYRYNSPRTELYSNISKSNEYPQFLIEMFKSLITRSLSFVFRFKITCSCYFPAYVNRGHINFLKVPF